MVDVDSYRLNFEMLRISDGNDGVLCTICDLNEPEGLSASTIFWVDCDKCGAWVINVAHG